MHNPVLLHEVIRLLDPKAGEFFIDGTVDGGGHARAILERVSPGGTLLAVDWDAFMVKEFLASMRESSSWVFAVHGNYAELPNILAKHKLPKADGLLIDLGFSSEQLETAGRGFSFGPRRYGEPLLMTYDDSQVPAMQILREISERELVKILRELSGERFAKRIAHAIKAYGRKKSIKTSGELAEVVRSAVPRNYERGRIHPATRTFQALRIYVNDELGNLTKLLRAIPGILRSGGRVGIISFHSLEDKLVKTYFRQYEKNSVLRIATKKPITPSKEEEEQNPRSRSAKLRVGVLT